MVPLVERMAGEFANLFGERPAAWAAAPGRVEVLGNHTDYNDGFILAAAIDRHVALVGRPIPGDTAKVYSRSFGVGDTFSVSKPEKSARNGWLDYIAGTVDELRARGLPVGAFEAVVDGDVPLGAGLSSSAALEVATAYFLKTLHPHDTDPVDMALICQAAENRFVGMPCGILDQFSSVMGRLDQLVFLDCRELRSYRHLPLGADVALVLANTNAPHQLVDGAYAARRKSCFEAAAYFAQRLPKRNITHLRDLDPADLEAFDKDLDETTYKRARHIVTENARVLDGADALEKGDVARLGRRMTESHLSSRDDFQNSCPELDAMVGCAGEIEGCYGARLSGGGFGGCTVNLVDAAAADAFGAELARRYKAETGLDADLYRCRADDGATAGAC